MNKARGINKSRISKVANKGIPNSKKNNKPSLLNTLENSKNDKTPDSSSIRNKGYSNDGEESKININQVDTTVVSEGLITEHFLNSSMITNYEYFNTLHGNNVNSNKININNNKIIKYNNIKYHTKMNNTDKEKENNENCDNNVTIHNSFDNLNNALVKISQSELLSVLREIVYYNQYCHCK